MAKTLLSIKLEPETLTRLDEARGLRDRTAFITSAIEAYLSPETESPHTERERPPAKPKPTKATKAAKVAPLIKTASKGEARLPVATRKGRFRGVDAVTGEEIWG